MSGLVYSGSNCTRIYSVALIAGVDAPSQFLRTPLITSNRERKIDNFCFGPKLLTKLKQLPVV